VPDDEGRVEQPTDPLQLTQSAVAPKKPHTVAAAVAVAVAVAAAAAAVVAAVAAVVVADLVVVLWVVLPSRAGDVVLLVVDVRAAMVERQANVEQQESTEAVAMAMRWCLVDLWGEWSSDVPRLPLLPRPALLWRHDHASLALPLVAVKLMVVSLSLSLVLVALVHSQKHDQILIVIVGVREEVRYDVELVVLHSPNKRQRWPLVLVLVRVDLVLT